MSSSAPPRTARTLIGALRLVRQRAPLERLPFPPAPAALGRDPRAQRLGSDLDAAGRRRGRAPDERYGRGLAADRGPAAAGRARGQTGGLVPHRIPAAGPFGTRAVAQWRRVSRHARVAQRQAARLALRLLRALRLTSHALHE